MARSRRRDLLNFAVEHSLALPLGAAIALVWANLAPLPYFAFAHALEFAVNDVGMVFFFALAAKEVVEATAPGGALHTWKRAALPVVAAAGGMMGPTLIYLGSAHAAGRHLLERGWAIPCATDIAFSYLVARAIFGRHPAIPFLLLLAIADDAFGLVILAVFYPVADLRIVPILALMSGALGAAFVLRRRAVRNFWPYIIVPGALSWVALMFGGLHPALALVPVIPFLPHAARDPGLFVDSPPGARDPLSQFEHRWKYPVQVILFGFGLVNAGVPLAEVGAGTWLVLVAVLAGKPVGIIASVLVGVRSGLHLPARLHWRDLIVVGFTAAIGFTVALFFATAAFPPGALLNETKLGALMTVASAPIAFGLARVLCAGRFAPARLGGPAG